MGLPVDGTGCLYRLNDYRRLTNERSIGGGDVKLFAMIGFAVGWKVFFLYFSLIPCFSCNVCICSETVRWNSITGKSEFPFAPFILSALC